MFAVDERDHHRPHDAHALQVPPERRIQRAAAGCSTASARDRAARGAARQDGVPMRRATRPAPQHEQRDRRPRARRLSTTPCASQRWHSSSRPAPNACDTSVSRPSSRPIAKMPTPMKSDAADADRADRLGAERADHQRVDQPHRHPPELGEDDGHRQREHRAEFLAEVASGHGHVTRGSNRTGRARSARRYRASGFRFGRA